MGKFLPRDVLEIPKIACLNLHASLLPRWARRGADPGAIACGGDRETGITVMYMDEGLDTETSYCSAPLLFARRETGGSLRDRLAQIAPQALLESLELLATGGASRIHRTMRLRFTPRS